MAELRDRYKGHGFDDDGNDKNMKTFEKATRQLLEFSQKFPREYKQQLQETKEEYTENLKAVKDLAKEVGSSFKEAGRVIGSSTRSSMANAAATATQAIVGGAGPIGYILEKTLNLSGGVKALVENFGTGSGSKVSSVGGEPVATEKAKKVDKAAFEAYPTIVKLRSWLNYQTKDNPLFRKYMLTMQQRAKEERQSEKEQKKEQAQMKKIFQKMKENSDKDALKTSLIVAGVVAGVAAIVGIGLWVKSIYDKNFGGIANTSMENPIQRVGEQFKSGDYAGQQKITSDYGKRPPVVDQKTGKVVSPSGTHYGIDISTPEGSPVKSLTPGMAYARMQTQSGFKDYKRARDRKDLEPLAGYGIFVDVVCLPATAQRIGFPGRRVTIRYAHLSGVAISANGTKITRGQIIGYAGKTGAATGSHVHIEVLVDGNRVPTGSIGTQMAVGATGSWEREYTVNPESLKFLDKEGRITTAAGAFMSWSSESMKAYDERTKEIAKPAIKTKSGVSVAPTRGVGATGYAANISLSGKNEILMGANNIAYGSTTPSKTTSTGQQGYVGTLPNLMQAVQAQQKQSEPQTQLNFDIQNSATKALKQADKSIDFMKV